MITGCYLPTWCKLDLDDGRTVNALVFIMDPRHPLFEAHQRAGDCAVDSARQRPAYQRSVSVLARSGAAETRMYDACLDDLVGKVRHLLGKAASPGWLKYIARFPRAFAIRRERS